MPEYVLSPEKAALPSAPFLMEEMHRRGFPVEINVKGSAEKWDAVRFYEPGPPEVECFLSSDPASGRLNVSVSTDSPHQAHDLQMFLVELLLKELGGQADNPSTRERFTAKEFSALVRNLHQPHRKTHDTFWLAFSWAVVAFGAFLFFSVSPTLKAMTLVILVLSFLSAAGLTYTHLKT